MMSKNTAMRAGYLWPKGYLSSGVFNDNASISRLRFVSHSRKQTREIGEAYSPVFERSNIAQALPEERAYLGVVAEPKMGKTAFSDGVLMYYKSSDSFEKLSDYGELKSEGSLLGRVMRLDLRSPLLGSKGFDRKTRGERAFEKLRLFQNNQLDLDPDLLVLEHARYATPLGVAFNSLVYIHRKKDARIVDVYRESRLTDTDNYKKFVEWACCESTGYQHG